MTIIGIFVKNLREVQGINPTACRRIAIALTLLEQSPKSYANAAGAGAQVHISLVPS